MNWTKFSISTLIGGIAYFLLGWLIYGILLKDLFALPADIASVVEYPPEEFKISLMAISCLAYGALLSYIFMQWAGISTFIGGFKGAAIIGVLLSLTFGFSLASMYKMGSAEMVLMDAVVNIVVSGLTGGVIGWYLGRGK